MKLISEEKRNEGFDECLKFGIPKTPNFSQGVDFAELELQNIAIEFLEWIVQNAKAVRYNRFSTNEGVQYSTTELFTKFLEQRNK